MVVAVSVPQEEPYRAKESRLRQTILKIAGALAVTIASMLLFLIIPLFPRELMIFVAIGLGALAYKATTAATVLMVLLALPGYIYQLNSLLPAGIHVPVPVIAIISIIMLMIATLAGEMGGVLGFAGGVIAAMCMLTPMAFLALPILVGTILFRTKNTLVRVGSAILTFIILYYPMLAANIGMGPATLVPILKPISYQAAPPVSVLGFEEIANKFTQIFGTGSSQESLPFLQSLTEYWPLSLRQRLFPAGILLALLAGAAIAIVSTMLTLFHWLRKREVGGVRLGYLAPVLALPVGILTFTVLVNLLAEPLYFVSPPNLFLMVVGSVAIGGCGASIEVWLRQRDIALVLRDQLNKKAVMVRQQATLLANRMDEVKAQCPRMDSVAEDTLLQMCEQELNFTEQAVTDMAAVDLEDKVKLFENLDNKLHTALEESIAKLYKYYDEDWQRYNDALMLAKGYGFSLGESIQGQDFSTLTSMEYCEVLKLQGRLNERYEASVRKLAEDIKELETRLCNEVDPDFGRIGIDIACDYIEHRRFSEAMEEFLRELGDIEYVLGSNVAGLDKEVASVLYNLRAIVSDIIIPTAANRGDTSSVKYYYEVITAIDKLNHLPNEKSRLPDLMQIVSIIGGLGELTATLCARMGEKMESLETSIRDKVPHGYSLALYRDVLKSIMELSQKITKRPNLAGIRDHIASIKSAPAVIETASHAIKNYSITHELLANYPSIEYLIEQKLNEKDLVNNIELPVGRKYANEYLEIYHLNHPADVSFERDAGRLSRLYPTPTT